MEPYKQPQAYQDAEISLKDLILKIKSWVEYLFRQWKIILLFGIIGAGIGLLLAFSKKTQYVGKLTFVLEDSKSNVMGSYAGLASQFGIDLGGVSGGSGVFTGDNIIEFLRSRLMVQRSLLSSAVINGKEKSLADHYIDISKLRDEWAERPELKNIKFPTEKEQKGTRHSQQQDSILNLIYTTIVKENLIVSKPDKKLSFILVQFKSIDQEFSKVFTERVVNEAISFYVATKTKRSKTNVDKLQQKADSIETLLNQKTYNVAVTQDLNLNPARSVAGVRTEVATRDKMVLQTMYAEVVKNLEISRMSMAQETPIIQIIDSPILPLDKMRPGKIKYTLIGGFLGGLIILIWLIIRRLYKAIMQ